MSICRALEYSFCYTSEPCCFSFFQLLPLIITFAKSQSVEKKR